MAEFNVVEYRTEGRIAFITINRPDAMNALSLAVRRELNVAFADFQDNNDLWVAILTGAGERAFSAGADIKAFGPNMQGRDFEVLRPDRIWKPFIAAIHGYCLGGGMELAMECDIRIAADNARLGQPEVKIGFMPGAGGTQRLPRFVPRAIAAELLLTGRHIDAGEAYRIGLVNAVVPRDKLAATAKEWAALICEAGPLAVRATKEAMIRGFDLPLDEGLKVEKELVLQTAQTSDFVEGAKAFKEKRKPNYVAT